MAGRFAPPPDVRANTRWRPPFSEHHIAASRHGASRHCRRRALTRHAIIPTATSLFVSATTTTALHASKAASPFSNEGVYSFSSERITAFFN